MDLRSAMSNIHRDPDWWKKVLIGGALALTIVGMPWPAGMVVESMDFARKGFPSPLPPWRDWGNRYVIGLLALLIDFVFFLLPLLALGVITLCVVLALSLGGTQRLPGEIITLVLGLLLLAYQMTVFLLGLAPVGRLLYIREGLIEEALGGQTVREALYSVARSGYRRARLRSLPAYLPAALLAVLCWLVVPSVFPGSTVVLFLLIWLVSSAIFYAHLVVAQLYAAVARAVGM